VLDLWLERKKIGLKKSSYAKYFNLINNHIKPQLGDYWIREVDSAVLNPYISEKYKTGNRKSAGGLSEKTLKNIVSLIKSALQFAKEERLLHDTPALSIIFPREKSLKMRVFSKTEQAVLEKYLCTRMNTSKLGVFMCLYTGLRIGEICSLKWQDISLDNHTLTVNSTMQRIQLLDSSPTKTKIFITEPKSNCSARTIPLPDILVSKLQSFRPADQNTYVLTGKTAYIEPRTYHNHFKAHIAAAGLKHANFHATRHTFATRCVEVGFELKSLSEILGHANVNITLNRYIHPSLELKRNNMNKLCVS